ncbi:hypothetical protein DPSP01_005741 [Paraphaeosphaeria sporulosa]
MEMLKAAQQTRRAQALSSNSTTSTGTSNGTKPKKRKKSQNDHHVEAHSAFQDQELDMSTSPEASKAGSKKKRKKNAVQLEGSGSATKNNLKTKQAKSPSKACQEAPARDPTPEPVQPVKDICLHCCKKRIKCNEAKPNCDQCLRVLWTCQYRHLVQRSARRTDV